MPQTVPRVLHYKKLPKNVQAAVKAILDHQRQIHPTTVDYLQWTSLTAGPALLFIAGPALGKGIGWLISGGKAGLPMPWNVAGIYGLGGAAVSLGLAAKGAKALSTHERLWLQEELRLFRLLRRLPNRAVRSFLAAHPYFSVGPDGNLIGRKSAPHIGFLPLGRRRIPTQRAKWKSRVRRGRR